MCGLIGFVGRKNADIDVAKEFILDQYDEQQHRGSRGFGLIRISNTHTKVRRATQELKALIDVTQAKENVLLFHHRQPTSTNNEQHQTHPIHVRHAELEYDWYVMHNGIISNSKELAKVHQDDLGYIYTTRELSSSYKSYVGPHAYEWHDEYKFNDSEAFAIELVRYLEGKSQEIGTFGAVAFIAAKVNKETGLTEQVLWGRNDSHNDLVVAETPEGLIFASELQGGEDILNFTAQAIDLKYLFQKRPPKSLMDKVDTLGLVFRQEKKLETPVLPAKTETHTMGFTFDKEDEEEKREERVGMPGSKMSKDPAPGYTQAGWALYKLGLRNVQQLYSTFFDYLSDLEKCYSPEEADMAYEDFTNRVDDFMMDMTTRSFEIISHNRPKDEEEGARQMELAMQKDVDEFMEEVEASKTDAERDMAEEEYEGLYGVKSFLSQ